MKQAIKIIPLAIFLLACSALEAQEPEPPRIIWQKDLDTALKESYLTGRPLFLHFCPEGRIALNEDMSTFLDNRVRAAAIHFVWVRLDPEKNRELGDKYGVKEIPSLAVVDFEKKKLNSKNFEGHAFPEDVFALMKEVQVKVKIVAAKDIEKLRKNFSASQKLLESKKTEKAISLLKKVARFKREIGFVIEARKALKAIEDAGLQKIEEAKKLFGQGKKDTGDKLLREVEKEYRGLEVSKEARKVRLEFYKSKDDMKKLLKQEREAAALKIFKMGQMYEDNKKSQKALEEYEKIVKEYPDTEMAGPASDKVKELRELLGK